MAMKPAMTGRGRILLIAMLIMCITCSCSRTGGATHSAKTAQPESRAGAVESPDESESLADESGDPLWNGLCKAISDGNEDKVKAILASRPEFINRKDETGLTILHRAVIANQSDVTRFLIEKGMDLNAQDSAGMTPLHFAAKKGNLEAMRALLDHHAYVNVTDSSGQTPLAYAQQGGFRDVVALLKERRGRIPESTGAESTTGPPAEPAVNEPE